MAEHTVKETLTSAPVKPVDEAARRARYLELRKKMGKPRSFVKGLPGVHYFWARKEDSAELARLDMIGYAIVREPNAKDVLDGKAEPKIQASGLREDGTYVLGDVILTSCPEEVYEFSLMDVDEKHSELSRSAKENFLNEAEKAGAPTFTITK